MKIDIMWNIETSKNYWFWINEKYFPIYEDFNNIALHVEKEKDNKYTLIIMLRGKVIDTSELIFEDEETISKYKNNKDFDKLTFTIKEQLTLQMLEKKDNILIIPEKILISHSNSLCFENIWVYNYKKARWTKVKVNTIKGKYFVFWDWDMNSYYNYWLFAYNLFMDVETRKKFIIKDSVLVEVWIPKVLRIGDLWEKFCFTEKEIQEYENLLCWRDYSKWNLNLNKFWLPLDLARYFVVKNKIFTSLFNFCKAKLKELKISNYDLYISDFDYGTKNKYWRVQTILEFKLNILVDNTISEEINEKIYKYLQDENVRCDSDLTVKCILDLYSDFFCLHNTLFEDQYYNISNVWNYYVLPDASHKSELNIYMLNQENNRLEFVDNIYDYFYTCLNENWKFILVYINKKFQLKVINPLTNEIEVLEKLNHEIFEEWKVDLWANDEKNFFLKPWDIVNHFTKRSWKYEKTLYTLPWMLSSFYHRNSVECVIEMKKLLTCLNSAVSNLKLSSNNFVSMYRFKKITNNSKDFSIKKYVINDLPYIVFIGKPDIDCINYRYMRWLRWMRLFSKLDTNISSKFDKLIWKTENLFSEWTTNRLASNDYQKSVSTYACVKSKCAKIQKTSITCLSNNKLSFYVSLKEDERIQFLPLTKWK